MTDRVKTRIGVVGMGTMGREHAESFVGGSIGDGVELTALCDLRAAAMEGFGGVECFTDPVAMFQSGTVDAVVIATPHYDHTTLGIAALEAGLHVLVEKPISVHKADAERLIAAHRDEKQVFAAMFNQRTDPLYRKVRELIALGELGRLLRVNWTITHWYRSQSYYNSGGWRATWKGEGGGVLLNQCPHQIDLWQWMFGMPDRVRAFCHIGKYHAIEVEDDVTAYFEYGDGMSGTFITSTGEAPGTNRLEIACDRGRLVVEDGKILWKRTEMEVSEHCANSPERFSKPPIWEVEVPTDPSAATKHRGILRNFVAAIRDGAELLAPAREGIHSVELANAMLYSSMQGETVEMPLDGAVYAALLEKLIRESTFEKKAGVVVKGEDFGKSQ